MRTIIDKTNAKKYAMMQCHKKAINVTTNINIKIYLTLPRFSATKHVTWNCYMYDYTKGRYDMILDKLIWTALILNLEAFEKSTEADNIPLKGCRKQG